jgi:hypothetical protein
VQLSMQPLIERLGLDPQLEESGDGHVSLQLCRIDSER